MIQHVLLWNSALCGHRCYLLVGSDRFPGITTTTTFCLIRVCLAEFVAVARDIFKFQMDDRAMSPSSWYFASTKVRDMDQPSSLSMVRVGKYCSQDDNSLGASSQLYIVGTYRKRRLPKH